MGDFDKWVQRRFFDVEPVHFTGPAMVTIPELEVPAAPTPAASEPESASVQVLRGLLAERRDELKRVEAARASRVRQVEDAERRAADLRGRVEQDDRHIAAAQEAIEEISENIAALGGRL